MLTAMDEKQQILYMQVRILRLASEKVNLSLKETAGPFKKYDVLPNIRLGWGAFM